MIKTMPYLLEEYEYLEEGTERNEPPQKIIRVVEPEKRIGYRKFVDGMWTKYGVPEQDLIDGKWIYAGGDRDLEEEDISHYNRYKRLYPGEPTPEKSTRCVCGVQIARNRYIANKNDEIIIVGSSCINHFIDKRLTCTMCGERHKNRETTKCNTCKIKCPVCGKPQSKGRIQTNPCKSCTKLIEEIEYEIDVLPYDEKIARRNIEYKYQDFIKTTEQELNFIKNPTKKYEEKINLLFQEENNLRSEIKDDHNQVIERLKLESNWTINLIRQRIEEEKRRSLTRLEQTYKTFGGKEKYEYVMSYRKNSPFS